MSGAGRPRLDDVRPPDDVRPIGIEDLERLGLNGQNQLFWDDKRIEVRQALTLTTQQKVLAIIVSVFAILGGLGGFVTGLNNAANFLCARGSHWPRCPDQGAAATAPVIAPATPAKP